MRGLVLACGDVVPDTPAGVRVARVPALPGKPDVDPLLADSPGRLVVAGTDGDLAAVVLRLLRIGRLAEVAVGFVPADPRSPVAGLWGLPTRRARALAVALDGDVRDVPLIRDDAGGVLLGRGVLAPVRGGIAYCDDEVALRGHARSLEVTPDPAPSGAGLRVRVRRRWARARSHAGRAVQIGCDPVTPIRDGVAHPRRIERWTWYRHTDDLPLIRP